MEISAFALEPRIETGHERKGLFLFEWVATAVQAVNVEERLVAIVRGAERRMERLQIGLMIEVFGMREGTRTVYLGKGRWSG